MRSKNSKPLTLGAFRAATSDLPDSTPMAILGGGEVGIEPLDLGSEIGVYAAPGCAPFALVLTRLEGEDALPAKMRQVRDFVNTVRTA